MKLGASLALIIGAVVLAACYRTSSYVGDGHLIDNGWRLKGGRYAVDLGPIDVGRTGTYVYKLKGLPDAEFVIGIEIADRDLIANHKTKVRVALEQAGGQTVVAESGSLEEWVRSHGLNDTKSFLYRRGEGEDIALADGGTKGQRVGVRTSGGWGSYFTAKESLSYDLTFQVLSSGMPQRAARLMLKSVDE
jgi:hypothetical protein